MGAPAVASPVVDLSTAASECGVGATRHLEGLDALSMVDSREGCLPWDYVRNRWDSSYTLFLLIVRLTFI